jgi:hypothetical protein
MGVTALPVTLGVLHWRPGCGTGRGHAAGGCVALRAFRPNTAALPPLSHTHHPPLTLSLPQATTRIRKNAAYFRVNYAAAAAGAAALALVLHPGALAVLAALGAGWAYLFGVRTTPLTINGRTLSHREQLLAAGGLSVFVVFFLTGVGALLFSALGFAGAAVAAHASFRVPDELFTDEVDPSAGSAGVGVGGLMSLLGGAGGLLGGGGGASGAARPVAAAV